MGKRTTQTENSEAAQFAAEAGRPQAAAAIDAPRDENLPGGGGQIPAAPAEADRGVLSDGGVGGVADLPTQPDRGFLTDDGPALPGEATRAERAALSRSASADLALGAGGRVGTGAANAGVRPSPSNAKVVPVPAGEEATHLRITAKSDGFRRGGVAHSATATLVPAETFSPEQLEALSREPMLVVERVSIEH